jgi:hypothetical protein
METCMSMDREIINKLSEVTNELRNEFSISIFLIIKREDNSLWDIVIGGEKLDTQENLIKIANYFQKKLPASQLKNFSRVVLLNSTEKFVDGIKRAFSVESGDVEIKDSQVNEVFINHAYLLYSKG